MIESVTSTVDSEALIDTAEQNVKDILNIVFNHTTQENAVVVYDTNSLLSTVLMKAYKRCLPDALFIDFNMQAPEDTRIQLEALEASAFVALLQSTNFRLDAFRIRVELFKKKIKVIEHPHLSRISNEDAKYYIDALAYDADYYRGTGTALKQKIDAATSCTIDSGGELLVYSGPFESAKLNIGDYTEMPNTGGQFPIGEVFTEAQDLKAVNGRLNIMIFGDITFKINRPKVPITLIIEGGQVVDCENATPEFTEVLSMIRKAEGVVWIRELGFGLNRAFTKTRTVGDVGSFERMCGVHVSLGAKHGMYGKPGFKRRSGRYHVDIFADTHTVTLGDEVIYREGAWRV